MPAHFSPLLLVCVYPKSSKITQNNQFEIKQTQNQFILHSKQPHPYFIPKKNRKKPRRRRSKKKTDITPPILYTIKFLHNSIIQ